MLNYGVLNQISHINNYGEPKITSGDLAPQRVDQSGRKGSHIKAGKI